MSSVGCEECIACFDERAEGVTIVSHEHGCIQNPFEEPKKSAPIRIPEPNPWSRARCQSPTIRAPPPAQLTRQYPTVTGRLEKQEFQVEALQREVSTLSFCLNHANQMIYTLSARLDALEEEKKQ
jgi:hypothetical protein